MQVDFISKKICSLASEIDLGWGASQLSRGKF